MEHPLPHVQTVDVTDGLFALRPDYGDQGNVRLWANYFGMDFKNPKLVLYMYEMTFKAFPSKSASDPDEELSIPEGKKLVQVIRCALNTSNMQQVKSDIATDFSKKLISCKELRPDQMKTGKFSFWAENEATPRTNPNRFQMILEHQGELRVSDLLTYLDSNEQGRGVHDDIRPIVQALDIILGHRAKLSLDTATPKQGKCFPQRPDTGANTEVFRLDGPPNTGGYLHGVRGFFASVRATTNRTLVNCNACVGAFYKIDRLDNLFRMFLPSQNPTLEQYKRLESAIRGLRVEFPHLGEKNHKPMRTVFGLAHPYGGPTQVSFRHKVDNRTYTVAQYWEHMHYGSTGNPDHPVVNVGNKQHPTFVPANVCHIFPGQMAKKRLDSTQTVDMIKHARRDPGPIMTSIENSAFDVLRFNSNPTLNSFGISLQREMVVVQGCVLQSPTVSYGGKSGVAAMDRRARWNMLGKTVSSSQRLENWGILRIVRYDDGGQRDRDFESACSEFVETLKSTLGDKKIDTHKTFPSKVVRKGNEDALTESFVTCKNEGLRFLLIVLPDNDASTYKQIKTLGDVDHGITTVCVLGKMDKFLQHARQYYANVALKINLKLGGINHTLRNHTPLYETTMVIGIDVTHPSPGPTKKTAPSVAAMVASIDKELGQWPVDLLINTASKEMVDQLGPMLATRLELWQSRHNNRLPENLLIYRDGVSESQYDAVLQEELSAIRNTCQVMYTEQPKITLIVVGKRHHTRFFRQSGQDRNPAVGTVVDKGITEARNWDFFLPSHHALLGTARPAHYFVLLNEIFTKELIHPKTNISDYLHKLTYEMCYLFGRSTGSVSIPPPVFYADLACERSRCYGDFDDDDISDTSSMTGGSGGNPPTGPGGKQLPHRPGNQALNKPGPSNSSKQNKQAPSGSSKSNPTGRGGSGDPASGKKEDASKKLQQASQSRPTNPTGGMSKKERGRIWEEMTAANSQRATGSSAKAEGKKPEANVESRVEGKTTETEVGAESKAEDKGKGKAVDKEPEPRSETKEKEKEAEEKKKEVKEKDKVEIHERLRDTMFYV